MKIQYIKGDLFETDKPIIAHGCNAQGVMGSGIAKIIREKYPEAYWEYRKRHDTRGLRLGEVIPAESDDKLILNCITQSTYGKTGTHVDYNAIRDCMRQINQSPHKEIVMPMIGAGLGGGDWEKIAQIIEDELTTVVPIVYYL